MVNLNYLNYISDINVGSALFTKAYKEKGAWGVGASFFSQGKIRGMSEEGLPTGDFTAKDISVNGFFSYDLSERWRGGASLKFLYSGIGDYTSIGMVVDAGLSYYDSEKGFSFGFAFKNIGAQLKAYEDERQKMPWDIQLGITKQMAHAPIRLSLTAQYLTKWKVEYVDDYDREYTGDNFFKSFMKHLVIGVDYVPSDNFWLGIRWCRCADQDVRRRCFRSQIPSFSSFHDAEHLHYDQRFLSKFGFSFSFTIGPFANGLLVRWLLCRIS